MAKLSVVISAYNEEKNIKECLESVKWASEIILVDSGSTDKTVEIAKNYQVKIFPQPNNLMLNVNKNYGFTKANNEWILNLDADERVTPELEKEIKVAMEQWSNGAIVGFWLPRKNIIFGKWIEYSGWSPDYQLRLFRKGKGNFSGKHIHELLIVDGETAYLKNHLLHLNYNSITQFLNKLSFYTENEAENLLRSSKKIVWQDSVRMPTEEFLKRFFVQKAHKDGLHGLILSMLMAFYHLVIFCRVWEKQRFREEELGLEEINKEFKKSEKEINYWLWEVQIREAKNQLQKLIFKLKRKLENTF